MSDEQREALMRRMDEMIREAAEMSPQEAREYLMEEGLCDERGQLTPQYGG